MATEKGVWDLQEVRDKQLASEWSYDASKIGSFYLWGDGYYGSLGNNKGDGHTPGPSVIVTSPILLPGTWANGILNAQGNRNGGIKTDGTLWMWGRNLYGALGQNNTTNYSSPVQIPGTWKKRSDTPGFTDESATLVTGPHTTLGMKSDSTLWGWGSGYNGVLGQNNNSIAYYSSPVQIPGTTWRNFSTSGNVTGLIKTDGTLWMVGSNDNGMLGLNADGNRVSSPTQVGTNTNWNAIECQGDNCHIATKTDGTLWVWGANYRGELGQNEAGPSTFKSSPTQIPGTNWAHLCGHSEVCFVTKTDGTLWAWGRNESGETGQNNLVSISSPTQIPGTTWKQGAYNRQSAIFTKTDGTLWGLGINNKGSLGLGSASQTFKSSPVQIPGTTWFAPSTWVEGGSAMKT